MKRRDFVSRLGLGSAVLITPALGSAAPSRAQDQSGKSEEHEHGGHGPMHGSNANAVVNFGQWKTDPPLDRYPNAALPPPTNNHQLLPARVTIKAGGSVSFIISGLHQILVYGPGVKPEDINTTLPTGAATTGVPLGVPLVNDPNNRIYRGPDPSLLTSLDRVESVHFPHPGRYLVICGVRAHFLEGMFGYVVVKK
jgi:plastocyanin